MQGSHNMLYLRFHLADLAYDQNPFLLTAIATHDAIVSGDSNHGVVMNSLQAVEMSNDLFLEPKRYVRFTGIEREEHKTHPEQGRSQVFTIRRLCD